MGALSLATFVSALDNTIVNVALPRIRADLAVTTTALEWVVTAYVLTFASLLFLGGRVSDRFGRRRVFVMGLTVFALASGGAACADSPTTLITARAFQGLGSALLLPASLSILGADVSPRARQYGAGIATAAAAAALGLGPVFGGVITEHWHWNGIFLVNLPVVAVCLALIRWGLPVDSWRRRRAVARGTGQAPPLGLPGIVTAGLTVSATVWLLIEAGRAGWRSPVTLAVTCTGAAAAIAFVALAAAGRATVLDGPLLRNRAFVGAVLASSLWGLGVNGAFFFTSLYLQGVLGLAPTTSGVVFVPVAVGLVGVVGFIGPVVTRFGARAAVATGLAGVALAMAWVSRLGADAHVPDLLPALFLLGVGSGLTVPLTALALEAVDVGRLGMASSLVTASRELAGAFGVAGIGAVVGLRSAALRGAGTGDPAAFLGGYQWGLRAGAVAVALGAVVAATMLRRVRPVVAGAALLADADAVR